LDGSGQGETTVRGGGAHFGQDRVLDLSHEKKPKNRTKYRICVNQGARVAGRVKKGVTRNKKTSNIAT